MEVGQLLGGRFRLLEVLGQGSFGVAWKAREEGSGLLVVLKVLRAQAAGSQRERERFRVRSGCGPSARRSSTTCPHSSHRCSCMLFLPPVDRCRVAQILYL